MFKAYDKVERWDHTEEVDGLLNGTCYIQEKIDGANSSSWLENNFIYVAKRSCPIASGPLEYDSNYEIIDVFKGLSLHILKHQGIRSFFKAYPHLRLYHEWLIKHTISYDLRVMNIAYVFDVFDDWGYRWLEPEEWMPLMQEFHIAYIPLLEKVENPTFDQLKEYLKKGSLFRDGEMEGIVIKNYNFVNKWGHQVFMKMVNKEFQEVNKIVFGRSSRKEAIEHQIITTYITEARVEKVLNKIKDEGKELRAEILSEVLGRVYHDLITEESWNIVGKRFKGAIINFRELNKLCTMHTKVFFFRILEDMTYKGGIV
mgnify:FL=1